MKAAPRRWICGLVTTVGLAAGPRLPIALAQEAATDPRPAPPRAEGEGPFERLIIRNATADRRDRGAAARPGGHRDRAEPHHRRGHRRRDRGRHAPERPAPGGHQGDRRHRDVRASRVRRPAPPLRRHPQDARGRSTSTSSGWPTASPRAAASPSRRPTSRRREKARSARNEITAPRMFTYRLPFDEWEGTIETPEKAREWVRMAAADRHRRLEAHRVSARDHGGPARRSEEARPRLDRAPEPARAWRR